MRGQPPCAISRADRESLTGSPHLLPFLALQISLRMLKAVVLATLLLAALASAEVVQLTDENFDSFILNSGKNSIVKFFAPW